MTATILAVVTSTVVFHQDGEHLGYVEINSNGVVGEIPGFLSDDAVDLVVHLLELGWDYGTVDGIDFQVVPW